MEGFNYTRLLQVFISFLITVLISFIAWQSTKWSTSIENLSKSVIEMNTRLQVLVSEVTIKNENTNIILKDHEGRIRILEKK